MDGSSGRAGELSQRQRAVLLAAIQDFIATAGPVGSQQLAARHSLGVRAAMVRNLMGELEESGYLLQPHTSAGRIPTQKAFRYYVDKLVPTPTIGFKDRAQIEFHYSGRTGDANEIIRDTSRLLALMTGQAALVSAPQLDSVVLERLKFVRLRENEVLAIFVAVAGGIQSRFVSTACDYDQGELDRMADYLNDALRGCTLQQMRQWIAGKRKEEGASLSGFVNGVLALGGAISKSLSTAELYIDGGSKALEQPEFSDPAVLRELLRALEEKTSLLDLLNRSLTQTGPMVSIGSENFDVHLSSFSLVAAPYASGSMPLGSLAVLGPVRMDYERVIPLVSYTARALSRVLEP